ncbi:hypothetical protein Hanom_Chr01g00023151 [Helianthus anomalus]
MRKNKPLDERRKTGQTSGTKMAFYSEINFLEQKVFWINSTHFDPLPDPSILPTQESIKEHQMGLLEAH